MALVLFPDLDPTNPGMDRFQYRMWGGGSGDFCHVSMFSTGICAEPVVLWIVIRQHAIIKLVDT